MRLLYISPNRLSPPISGGAQRTALLLSELRSFGSVDTVLLPDKGPSPCFATDTRAPDSRIWVKSTEQIARDHLRARSLGAWCSGIPGASAFIQAGRHRWAPYRPLIDEIGDLSRYDLVVARYLSSACILNLFRHPRLLIDVDDYDPDRLRQRITSSGWLKRLTLKRCLHFSEAAHQRFLPRAAHCWISNPADRRHPGLADASSLPNIPYFPAGLPSVSPPPLLLPDRSPVFLVVGTLSYSANSDGIDAFLRKAWPDIRASSPMAEFHIVGQGLSPAQKKRWSRVPGVKPIGFVENLDAAYANCLATIAPILAGGGTNIKVLESGAYGRACVVTAVAHRGFETTLLAGKACLRAETMKDMVEPCLRLLREPGLAERIGLAARHCVETHYTPEIFAAAVREGCARALASSGRKLPSSA